MSTIKELREKQFLSIGELAEKAGVSRTVIYSIENKTHKPIKRTIRLLAKALEVDPGSIEI